MGVYGASTFHQGDPATPAAHAPPASSACSTLATVGNGLAVSGTVILSTSATVSVSLPFVFVVVAQGH